MNSVYIVTLGYCEEMEIVAAFTTMDKAVDYVQSQSLKKESTMSIKKLEVR